MKIPSLNLTIYEGVLFIVSIAIILTIWSYFSPHKKIKEQEARLSNMDKITLYLNRLYHYCSTITIMFFPFIFKSGILPNCFYLLYLFVVFLSWKIYKECPITYWEKQMLDNNYKMGDNIKYEPYTTLIFHPRNVLETDYIHNAIIIMYYVNLIIVGSRVLYTYYKK
jgi:hypothetical protein